MYKQRMLMEKCKGIIDICPEIKIFPVAIIREMMTSLDINTNGSKITVEHKLDIDKSIVDLSCSFL